MWSYTFKAKRLQSYPDDEGVVSFRHVGNIYQSTVRNISEDLNQKSHFLAGLDIHLHKLSITNTAVPLRIKKPDVPEFAQKYTFLG